MKYSQSFRDAHQLWETIQNHYPKGDPMFDGSHLILTSVATWLEKTSQFCWWLIDSINDVSYCWAKLLLLLSIIVITYMSLSAICCTVHGVVFLPMFDMYWHIKTIDTSFVCIIDGDITIQLKTVFSCTRYLRLVVVACQWQLLDCDHIHVVCWCCLALAAVYPSWLTCRTDIWIVCAGCSRARLLAKRPERHGEQG